MSEVRTDARPRGGEKQEAASAADIRLIPASKTGSAARRLVSSTGRLV